MQNLRDAKLRRRRFY